MDAIPKGSRDKLEQLIINTIRTLSMDAVQKANSRPSGHPDGARAGGVHDMGQVHEV